MTQKLCWQWVGFIGNNFTAGVCHLCDSPVAPFANTLAFQVYYYCMLHRLHMNELVIRNPDTEEYM